MIDLIKRAMFTGIGVASLTKEKIEDISKEFVEKGKLSEQEGKKLVDELVTQSEESKKSVQAMVEGTVKTALQKMNIAGKSEVEELKKEIKELKKALEKKGEE